MTLDDNWYFFQAKRLNFVQNFRPVCKTFATFSYYFCANYQERLDSVLTSVMIWAFSSKGQYLIELQIRGSCTMSYLEIIQPGVAMPSRTGHGAP